jgi:hypothetical protein
MLELTEHVAFGTLPILIDSGRMLEEQHPRCVSCSKEILYEASHCGHR